MFHKVPNRKLHQILHKNNYVFSDSEYLVKSQKCHVNLNIWTNRNESTYNVGDYISSVIVDGMCNQLGIDIGKRIKKTRHLYAIGSILLGFQDATVWGSGFLSEKKGKYYPIERFLHKYYHKSDIRAVRGPETRRLLLEMGIDCPEIYGDPALLLPFFYNKNPQKTIPYLIIPHYAAHESYKKYDNVIGTFTNDWKSFVDKILQAEFVISSSLHGIIIAEAYGIPAVLLNDVPSNDFFKYRDYYYSTGRYNLPIANNIEEAFTFSKIPTPTTIIQKMQDDLIKSFPSDLWND